MSLLADYPALMLRAEVAEVLRVSTRTLSRWAQEDLGPRCIHLAEGIPRYQKGDVLTYLEGR